jgi:methylmalonyl-CoA mutase N-terminal domain/subunit
MVHAIETGWIQAEIGRGACEYQREIESGERVVIGVNRYASGQAPAAKTYRPDPLIAERQIAELVQLRKERDQAGVAKALDNLEVVARTSENIIPATVAAVKAYATTGEICGRLRRVFGEHADVATAGEQ